MSVSVPVSLHSPEVITLKLGRATVSQLRDLSTKQSISRMNNVTPADLIKEALKNTFPAFFSE